MFRGETAILGAERQLFQLEGLRKQGDMAKAQSALAPLRPVERQIEIDAGPAPMEPQMFLDQPQRRRDGARNEDVIAVLRDLALRPVEVGDLGLARLLAHAIAGVPVRLQSDVGEIAVRQAADARDISAEGEPLDGEAAPPVETRGKSRRLDIDAALAERAS